ncbi:MAG: DNA glycosylase [archaeon]
MLLDLDLTMRSGQTPHFVWHHSAEEGYSRALNGKTVTLSLSKEKPESNNEKFCNEMLRSEDDLEKICSRISENDVFMRKAVSDFRGLRITKSDAWETAFCFITSANNSIPNIRNSVQKSMAAFGEKNSEGLHEFPSAETISRVPETELRKCSLGFRAKYLLKTASMFCGNDTDFRSKEEAKEFLLSCPGIGEKVAECVCLFGYGFTDSFPVDVWMQRAMKVVYFEEKEPKLKEIYAKADELWGPLKGYAQQYLFYEFMSNKRREHANK